MTPAEHIIKKFHGAVEVAHALGVRESTVYRWTYPRERGGTGGLVPAKYQQSLLDLAPARGVDLGPDDFFSAQDTAA